MRRRWESEGEETRTARTAGAAAPAPVDRVLALQQSAGNHAVAGMLAREAAESEKPRYAVAIEEVGSIPVLSFRLGGQRGGTSGGAGGAEASKATEIELQSELGKHSPELVRAATRGTHWEKAVIQGPGVQWTFTDVFVASYQASGAQGDQPAVESWTLDAAKVAFS